MSILAIVQIPACSPGRVGGNPTEVDLSKLHQRKEWSRTLIFRDGEFSGAHAPQLPLSAPVKVSSGSSVVYISNRVENHFEVEASTYPCDRSIIWIAAPHASLRGHLNLYTGLKELIEANPKLADAMVATEGFPAFKRIDMSPLVAANPEPSQTEVNFVIGSFLIDGAIAYEWRHQRGLHFIGMEDVTKYRECRSFFLDGRDEGPPYAKRNQMMTNVILDALSRRGKVIAIGGTGHLTQCGADGIHQALQERGIGYLLLTPRGEETRVNLQDYRRLFQAQHSGTVDAYISRYLGSNRPSIASRRGTGRGITVRPSVRDAASLVALSKSSTSTADGSMGGGASFSGLSKRLAAILRAALRGKGNFSLGKATRAMADQLGRAWVGRGAKWSSNGKALRSADGTRTYRPPSRKNPNPRSGRPSTQTTQANFERIDGSGNRHNGHLTITN